MIVSQKYLQNDKTLPKLSTYKPNVKNTIFKALLILYFAIIRKNLRIFMSQDRVKQAISDIKQGKMVVMIDDEDRENEGDIVFGANFSTTKMVNFAISEAKGVLCVALTRKIAKSLNLDLMVTNNSSSHETAFTVSVDAKEASTGVSAYERDMTIKLLVDYNTKPEDLVRPGHIFPLIAKEGGVLERTGHTEGAVDLCKLAGIAPVAAICEIVKDDGEMARRPDLDEFCKKHKLNIIYVSDLVEYRMKNESLIQVVAQSNVEFMDENVKKFNILDHKNNAHTAFIFGKSKKKMAVKFHNISTDLSLLSDFAKFKNLQESIEYLKKQGGVLVFLENANNVKPLAKSYGIGAQILKYLGIEQIELLSSTQEKEYVGLSGFGLDIVKNVNV